MAKSGSTSNPEWPADRVERWPLKKIIKYDKNPRTHPPEQIAQLARSMKEDGVTMPILVDETGEILAGHGRKLAAEANGFEEYPVVVARGWTDEQKRAVRVKDNSYALMSGWDATLIQGEITWLKNAGYDVKLLGFGEAQLVQFEGPGIADPAGEWGGMPGFDQQDKTAFFSTVVHFKDQAAVDRFAKVMKQKITPKTRFLWYPEIEIETYVDKRYVTKK